MSSLSARFCPGAKALLVKLEVLGAIATLALCEYIGACIDTQHERDKDKNRRNSPVRYKQSMQE